MSSRREFIRKTALGTAAVSFGGILPGFSAKSYKNIVGSNEKIKIGAIGVNARGNALAEGFAKEEGCEIAYVCDVDRHAMEKCINNVMKIAGIRAQGEKDLRRLLEKSDIGFIPDDTRNPSEKLDAFHFSNFLNGIRKNTPLYADINIGATSTTLALLGNIAQRTNSVLKIDPSNGHIIDNPEAMKLWDREYEKGWEMKL